MMKRISSWIKEHEQGFSMLELLVYIGIVGVIVTFAIPKYTNTMAMANTAKIQSDLQTLDAAITMYNLQNGKNPTSITSDLKDYVAHVEQVKPPTGSCLLNNQITTINAVEYVIKDGEATLDGHSLDKFGKATSNAISGN